MRKNPFLTFLGVVGALVAASIWFIQSAQFAHVFKSFARRYLPADVGIEGDFSEFAVKLFPPGVSVRQPRIRVGKHNILGLPEGTSVSAERVDLTFRPIQMFSGNIRVHEVTVVGGDVRLVADPRGAGARGGGPGGKKPGLSLKKGQFHWDELFQVHAEAVAVENTRLHVESPDGKLTLDCLAESLRLGQWSGDKGLGYELTVNLKGIQSSLLGGFRLQQGVDLLTAVAHVNQAGLTLDTLVLTAPGMELSANGAIKGDVLSQKSPSFDADVILRGDAARIGEIAGLGKSGAKDASPVAGILAFNGKVRGSLDRIAETLRAEGTLTARDARFQKWTADQVRASLGWQSQPGGGEITVASASIFAKERARSGGGQPGGGGNVEVGAFKYRLGSPDPVTVPLTLERAHIHWLGAPALKEVYPLDFRATGPIGVTFKPADEAHPWSVDAKLGLSVDGFQLDNQRLGQVKPLRRVLSVPRIKVDGMVHVDPTGIRPEPLTLSLPHTVFKGSGRIDFKTGFDLYFTGNVNLADVGKIAENDIRGTGTLNTHVHGPSSRVFIDFDPDVKDAYYLRLRLGDLKGRITWDDDPQDLLLTGMQARKGHSRYLADGRLSLGKEELVDLAVKIPEGDIQDMIDVFDVMTGDLWWFPRTLTGPCTGSVQVSGGLDMKALVVNASVEGSEWEHYGERFKEVTLLGGYDRGKYYLSDFKATKRAGRVFGRISFDQDRVFDWGIHTEDFTVSDIDHVARLDVPIRGKLAIESTGHGREGEVRSSTVAQLDDVAVRGRSMPSSELTLKSENGILVARGSALGGQGTLDLTYDFSPGAASSLRASVSHLDFSPALLLLNPKLIQDKALAGVISGSVALDFRSGSAELASGRAELSEYLLAKSGARFELDQPVAFEVRDGSFDIRDLSLRGRQGEASLSLRGQHAALEGRVTGDLDVSVAEFATSSVSQATGTAQLDLALGGTLKSPTITGKALLDGVTLRVPSVESPFENVAGTLQLKQNAVSVQGLEGDLAGGRVTADGTILLYADRYPNVSLHGTLNGSKLKIFPFQFVKVHGDVDVHGDHLPYNVDGSLVVDSALSKEKVFNQKKGEVLKALQYTPPPSSQRMSDYPKFKLGVDVAADKGVLIQNDLFDIEAKAHVKVVNTLEAPRIVGAAELIQGRMVFKDRTFQIQSATASFDSPTVMNPAFSLTSTTDVNGTKIQLYATGRLDKWKVELTSAPVLPESEILSLLATGLTSGDQKKLSVADQAAFEQGQAASLLLNSLDVNREMESKTGFQIKLDESINSQVGTSVFRPQTGSEAIAQPKITIKRRINKNVDLSYGSTVGGGIGSERVVNAEVHVGPGFSVLGVWDNYEAVDTQDNRTSLGLDLKFQKRFK